MSMSPQEFGEALKKAFTADAKKVDEAAKKAVKKTSQEAKKVVKSHFPFETRSGEYAKAITVTKSYEDAFNVRYTISFKKNKQYLLTHLLEYGHAMKRGGRIMPYKAKAYPHMIYGDEYVKENLMKNIEKEVEKIK